MDKAAWRRIVIMMLLIAICLKGSVAGSGEPGEFRVGISGNGVTILAVWMGAIGGFYKKEGLNVEVVSLGGDARSIQALLSGKIEAISAGLGPVAQANRQGADMRVVASIWNTIPFTIFSLPNVKAAADLKGGTIGVSTFGSESDIAVTLALKQLGLNRKDVTIVQMGENSKRFGALSAGYVTAVPLAEPVVSIAREQGLHVLVDLTTVNIPWIFTGLVARRGYLESQRGLFNKFLRATIEASYFALADEKAAKEVIAAAFKTNNAKAIDTTYKDFKRFSPLDAEISHQAAENVLKQWQAAGLNVGDGNADNHIDNSIIHDLKRDGFFVAMKQKYIP